MRADILLIAGALAVGACASPTKSQPAAAQSTQGMGMGGPGMHGGMMGGGMMDGGMMGGDMASQCPLAVQGTTARAEDVEGGAAMAFTTTGDVAELRRKVAHMAAMHAQHGDGQGMGMMGGDKGMMGGGMMMPPSTAKSEEVEGGARLVFTPKDPADLPKLRAHVADHAQMMVSGHCPMMQMHGPHA